VRPIVLSISSDVVRAALVGRNGITWRRELARPSGSDLADLVAELLNAVPRGRLESRRVVAVVGPSGVQLKRLDGLPATRDALLLTNIVRESVARFFLVHEALPVTTPVWHDSLGHPWCAAFDAPLLDAIAGACDRARMRLTCVAPVLVLLPNILGDGAHVWRDGATQIGFEVRDGALIDATRRHAEHTANLETASDTELLAAAHLSARTPFVWRPRADATRRRWRRWRIRISAASAIAAALAATIAPTAHVIFRAEQMRANSASFERTRSRVEAQAAALDRTTAELDQLEHFAADRRSIAVLLRDLTTALPESTAIVAIRIDSVGGSLTAVATHAADVVSMLTDVDGIVLPRLVGAITRESVGGARLERAAIRFRFPKSARRS
jgi:hypothetical protein